MPAGGNSPKFFLPDLPPQARVLLIRLRSLGDLLLTTPALRALKQWRPDLRVSLVLYKEFAPILHDNPDVERRRWGAPVWSCLVRPTRPCGVRGARLVPWCRMSVRAVPAAATAAMLLSSRNVFFRFRSGRFAR